MASVAVTPTATHAAEAAAKPATIDTRLDDTSSIPGAHAGDRVVVHRISAPTAAAAPVEATTAANIAYPLMISAAPNHADRPTERNPARPPDPP